MQPLRALLAVSLGLALIAAPAVWDGARAASDAAARTAYPSPAQAFAGAITALCLPAVANGAEPAPARLERAGFHLDEGRMGSTFYAPTPEDRTPATPYTAEVGGVRVWGWVNARACSVRVENEEGGFTRAVEALRRHSPPWSRALLGVDPKALAARDVEIETAVGGKRMVVALAQYAGPAWPSGQWTVFTVAHVAEKSWDDQ